MLYNNIIMRYWILFTFQYFFAVCHNQILLFILPSVIAWSIYFIIIFLNHLALRTAPGALSVQSRTHLLGRISTAVCLCPMAPPAWHRLEPVWLCVTCWAACVRKEGSPWKISWSTYRARIRSHTHCPDFNT